MSVEHQGLGHDFVADVILASPLVIFEVALDDQSVVQVSPNVERVMGYRPVDVVGVPGLWVDLMHPDDRQAVLSQLAQHLERGEAGASMRLRYRHADGTYRWALASSRLVYDETGQGRRSYGYILDITDQLVLEERVRQSELFMARLAELVTDYVFVLRIDAGGTFTTEWMSNSYAADLGIDLHEAGIEQVLERVHPDDREIAAGHLSRALEGETVSQAVRVLGRDGDERYLNFHALAQYDERTGRVERLFGAAQDLTEHLRAMEALDRQARILHAVRDAVLVAGFDGRVIDCNRAAERLLGKPRTGIVGQPALALAHFDADRVAEVREAIAAYDSWEGAFTLERSDESTRMCEATVTPLLDGGSGNPVAVVVVLRDVTERVELEARLQQSQRLESLGRLAAGIAHDFNNLNSLTINYAQFIMEDLPTDVPDELQARLDTVRAHAVEVARAGERASALTRQLAVFGKRVATDRVSLDLNVVVRELESMLRRTIVEQVEVRLALADSLPAVEADRSQIEQAIVNLAVNARDAMPQGGTIAIGTSVVELDDEYARVHPDVTPGHYVRLTVADTGEGMTKDVAARAFEPFFTTRPGASGLGLATVYGTTAQAGGHVSLSSLPGRGAVVSVYLPVADPDLAPAVPVARGDLARGAGERVLIVEDDADVMAVARRILERNGYRVLQAHRPTEAMLIVQDEREPIDLLLADLVMPQMSGRDLAEHVHAVRPGTAILLMSGYPDEVTLHLGPGVVIPTPVLAKPFTARQLLDAVRQALETRGAPA